MTRPTPHRASGSAGLVVPPASREDWLRAEQWAADENWNPGLSDTACFHPTDPDGFFMGRLDGAAVSAVSVVNYSDQYAFLGHYLVAPEFRGRGIGWATWQAALPHAAGRTIGLDAVPEQEATYRKAGFVAHHRSVRYVGRPTPRPSGTAGGAVPVGPEHFDAVTAYDRACFPAARRGFLGRWLTAPGHAGYVVVRNSEVSGYGVIRPARNGMRVGPLFADTPGDAEVVLDALLTRLGPDDEVCLDVPEPNTAACRLAESRGLTGDWHTVRMYAGPAPRVADEHVFAGTSLELG